MLNSSGDLVDYFPEVYWLDKFQSMARYHPRKKSARISPALCVHSCTPTSPSTRSSIRAPASSVSLASGRSHQAWSIYGNLVVTTCQFLSFRTRTQMALFKRVRYDYIARTFPKTAKDIVGSHLRKSATAPVPEPRFTLHSDLNTFLLVELCSSPKAGSKPRFS